MKSRALRSIVSSLGGVANGFPREDGFDITVASEVMAIFCLASDLDDLKKRLSNIIVAYTRDRKPVRAGDLKAHGAMTALLKEALAPNLVQTLEGTPAFVHGGPFANIAHGCNSVLATTTALKLCDYVGTEAGFRRDPARRKRTEEGQALVSGRDAAPGEDPHHRQGDLPRQGHLGRQGGARPTRGLRGHGLRQMPGLHRQDAIQLLHQPGFERRAGRPRDQ